MEFLTRCSPGTAGLPCCPSLKKFFAASTVKMTVSIPEISSVSWSSFMTGTQAGDHGIYGFVDLTPGTYQYRFPNFSDLKAPTFFDELGLNNKRSVIINLPATYPARPMPGVLISGFVALDLEKAVYPARYLPMLKQAGYQVDVDAGKGRDKKRRVPGRPALRAEDPQAGRRHPVGKREMGCVHVHRDRNRPAAALSL